MSTGNLNNNPGELRKNQFKVTRKTIGLSLAFAVILLVVLFWGLAESKPEPEAVQAAELSVKAVEADKYGIDPEKGFLLTSTIPLNENTVKTALKVTPSFPYRLVKQGKGLEYRIVPEEPLKANTVYTIAFDPEQADREDWSWAFQTKGDFRVLGSLPRPRSTYVPLNTGIEITFSHKGFDLDQVKEYLTITPEVEGTLEKHDKTLVFVPRELQPATVYTVTLRKGLPLRDSDLTLAEDYSFSFETEPATEQQAAFSFTLYSSLTEFSSTDVPAFVAYFYRPVYQSEAGGLPAVEVALYLYPDYRAFQESLAKKDRIPDWAYFAWNGYREQLNPQFKIAEFQTEFVEIDAYSSCIVFPNTLEPGYYSAEFKAGDCVRQVWFQVSDLAVYLAQGEQNSLIWAVDLRDNAPPANLQVVIPGKQLTVNGDESGVVLINRSLVSDARDYALVKSERAETLVPLQPWPEWYARSGKIQDYWKYLYLDRGIYQPEDTVHFWGVLAPRNRGNGQTEPVVTIELYGGDRYFYSGTEIAPILTQKVPVQSKVFQGQLKLPLLKPGYYYLEVKIDDTVVLSRGFEVATYAKPSYTLTLTQDKKAVFAGETINFEVEASFFEGTPLPGLELSYYVQDSKSSVTTDQRGKARISYTPTAEPESSPYRYGSIGLNAVLPEAAEIYASAEFYVFTSGVYLTGETQRQDDGYTLNVKLSKVDLTQINAGEYPAEENFLTDTLPNRAIKGALYQEVWTAREIGRRYDYINKQVVPTYHYDYSTVKLDEFTLQTSADGTASYRGNLPDRQSTYFIELEAEDEKGRKTKRKFYIYGSGNVNPEYRYYSLQQKKTDTGYKPGEVTTISLLENQRELNPGDGSVLFFSGQKAIEHYQASKMPAYSFVFEQSHIPNYTVYGVYFDGRSFQETSPLIIPFAQETKKLTVQIDSDKSVYRPGEEVSLRLTVTDAEGRPVSGAQVNLNLVDEAIFSLRQQYVDFLSALYNDYINLLVLQYKSHRYPELPGGAEQGGEGGVERTDFRDTVLFTTLQTDSEGQADVKFTLPDNLTSWRVTYHAFTAADLQAGSGTVKIPVSLPFFVEMVLNKNYLAGDSPVVTLRSYGTELLPNRQVKYELKLTDSRGKQITQTVQGLSFEPVDWQLPILESGTYKLSVAASCGELRDALIKEFQVADSFQTRTVTRHELLSVGMTVDGSDRGSTSLVFSDYERSLCLDGLYRLAAAGGSRLEQKLAAYQAQKLITEYFAKESPLTGLSTEAADEQRAFTDYQQADGGISVLPYGSSDLALSAMVAVTAAECFDQGALKGYFYRLPEQESEPDRSLIMLGLASFREPVLPEINDLLQSPELAPEEKINLALALLELGDGARAKEIYTELLALYAEDLGSVIRINVGTNHDELLKATTQMAVLAARLDRPEKNKLYRYLLENNGKEFLNLVEQVLILQTNLKHLPASPVSFTYELDGQKVKKELKNDEVFILTLLPEDLEHFRITEVDGQVGLVAVYDRLRQEGEAGPAEDLAISRSYLVNGQKVTTVSRTDLVEVVLEYAIGERVPSGIFEIVDVLPAGLAPVSSPANYSEQRHKDWDYPVEVNGQRVVFLINNDRLSEEQITEGQKRIRYLARVVSPGEYVCEAPLLNQINNEDIFKFGRQDKLVIQ